jgi:hypothetical protein
MRAGGKSVQDVPAGVGQRLDASAGTVTGALEQFAGGGVADVAGQSCGRER